MRHGQTIGMEGRCCGRLDPPLSSIGRQRGCSVAAALANEPLAAIYASPLRRASDTAHFIAGKHGLEIHLVPDLREIDFGDLEGRLYSEIVLEHPALLDRWTRAPTTVHFPQGESYPEFSARVSETLECIRGRHAGETVAVVTHGGVVRTILALVLHLADPVFFRMGVPHGCATVIDWHGQSPTLRYHGVPQPSPGVTFD